MADDAIGLGRQRYVSVVTFRRDGSPVPTPVWVVADAGRLYVWTGAKTGKAKRARANPEVTVAPCTARGTVTGPAVAARAAIVALDQRPGVWPAFAAKYGIQLRAVQLAGQVERLVRRRAATPADRIYLELALDGDVTAPSAGS
jgi:uncharacterized protein